METPPPPDRPEPDRQPSPAEPPPPPGGPQAPVGPQAPLPGGPQAPPPPPGPQAPPGGPEAAPTYGGPIPPGGWQQPIPQTPGWHGRALASWGSRLAAYLLDGLILLVPVIGLTIIIVAIAAGSDVAGWVVGIIAFLAYIVAAFLYSPLLMAREGAHNGQTWGKQALGIRVIHDTGDAMSFGWSALREIVVKGFGVGVASSVIPFIPWFLNFFWPLWDDENRALHDMICSTHVVKT